MKKISVTVAEIINSDQYASEVLHDGLLNLSAYAKKIHKEVEKQCHKEIRLGSIVIALSRLKKNYSSVIPLLPTVNIKNMTIKSPLAEITYDKNQNLINEVTSAEIRTRLSRDYFTLISGITEVSLIGPSTEINQLQKDIKQSPKALYQDLGAVTVNFSEEEYLETPNMIHVLVSALAVKKINLIEIISTLTEITFVVREAELPATIEAMNRFFYK